MSNALALLLLIIVALIIVATLVRRGRGRRSDGELARARRQWKLVAKIGVVVVVSALLAWAGSALWDHPKGSVRPDRWLDVMSGITAAATTVALAVGGLFAAHYGRRASASLSATALATIDGVIINARPVIKAVGIFRVNIEPGRGALLAVTERHFDSQGNLVDGKSPEPYLDVFGSGVSVEAGEEVTTTVTVASPPMTDSTVGWTLQLNVAAVPKWKSLRPSASGWWTDQCFVERPRRAEDYCPNV